MNLEDIKVGNKYKNYATLCEALKIKPKNGGKGKKYQVEEIERYIKYSKDRFTYIIEEVYSTPLPKKENLRNTLPSIKYMELLLLHILKDEGNKITISNSKLAERLKMIHSNFTNLYKDVSKVSNELGVDLPFIDDFRETTSSAYKNSIQTILNRLERKNIIAHQEIYIVSVEEENNNDNVITRPATDYEIEDIVRTKNRLMKKYGSKYNPTMKEVIQNRNLNNFKKELHTTLYNLLGITFFYKAHVIHAPDNFLKEEYMKILQESKLSRYELELAGNKMFAKENENRFKNKKESAQEKFQEDNFSLTEKEKLRLDPSYEPYMSAINSYCVRV